MSINLYHHTSSFQCPLTSSLKRAIETYFHFYLTLCLHPLLLWIDGMTALLCICITNKLCMTNTCLGALYRSQYVELGFNIHPLVWMDLGSLFLLRKAPLCFPGSPMFGNLSLWLAPGSFKHCYLVGHSITDKKWRIWNPLSHDWVMHKFSLFSVLTLLSFFDRIYFEFEFFISCSLEYRNLTSGSDSFKFFCSVVVNVRFIFITSLFFSPTHCKSTILQILLKIIF